MVATVAVAFQGRLGKSEIWHPNDALNLEIKKSTNTEILEFKKFFQDWIISLILFIICWSETVTCNKAFPHWSVNGRNMRQFLRQCENHLDKLLKRKNYRLKLFLALSKVNKNSYVFNIQLCLLARLNQRVHLTMQPRHNPTKLFGVIYTNIDATPWKFN